MRKIVLVLLLLFSVAQAKDIFSFIETDKRLHIGSSYILADVFHNQLGLDLFGQAVAMGAASLVKGLYDEYCGGRMDLEDAIANYIGLGLCYLINQQQEANEKMLKLEVSLEEATLRLEKSF